MLKERNHFVACVLLAVLYLAAPSIAGSVHSAGGGGAGQEAAKTTGPLVTTYPINQSSAYPVGVTTDAAGHVWFAEDNINSIGELFPSNSTVKTYPVPTNHHLAWVWYMFFDKNGVLWFSDETQRLIWSFDPATDAFANYTAGTAYPMVLHYVPEEDRIWFTSLTTDQLGYFGIQGEKAVLERVTNITAPTPGAGLSGIAVDSAGDVFVSETFVAKIVELNGSSLSVVRTWYLPKDSQPVGLALDQARGVLWFTNHATSFFGYVDLNSSSYKEYPTSLIFLGGAYTVSLPYWVFLSSSGYVWFNEHVGNRIARFDPSDSQLTEFDIPTNSSSPLMVSLDDSRGLIWFTEFSGNAVGVIDQNSSLGDGVGLSVSSATVDPTATFSSVATPGSGSAPVVSATAVRTGVPQPGFDVSTTSSGGSYDVKLSVDQATPGNYTAAVCFRYAYDNQCGYLQVAVPAPGWTLEFLYSIYGAAGLGFAVLAALVVREMRGDRRRRGLARDRLAK